MKGAGWSGEDGNWEIREELAKQETKGACTTRMRLASPPIPRPVSLTAPCPCSSCYRCLGHPLSWVACLGLPSELTSLPPPSLPPIAFFILFTHTVGVGSNAVILLSKNRLFSISFPLEFPVYEGKSASMKDQVSFNSSCREL